MLLAGPGTGKTSRVKEFIDKDYTGSDNILVLSFTNATVNDLITSFSGYPNVKCYTLHSYALKINHQRNLYILDGSKEASILKKLSDDLDLEFPFLCSLHELPPYKTAFNSRFPIADFRLSAVRSQIENRRGFYPISLPPTRALGPIPAKKGRQCTVFALQEHITGE